MYWRGLLRRPSMLSGGIVMRSTLTGPLVKNALLASAAASTATAEIRIPPTSKLLQRISRTKFIPQQLTKGMSVGQPSIGRILHAVFADHNQRIGRGTFAAFGRTVHHMAKKPHRRRTAATEIQRLFASEFLVHVL